MRLHKVVNRVYQGTTYYRWLIAIPPKHIRELGWAEGQPLEVAVRGSSLWIQPSSRTHLKRPPARLESIEQEFRRRTAARISEDP
jgi:antitoxin component of MazEF toxin-antitoxin module